MALQHDAVPARLSLSESEDRLRVALDAAGIGVVQWEPATGRLSYGGHVRGVFGRDAEIAYPLDERAVQFFLATQIWLD